MISDKICAQKQQRNIQSYFQGEIFIEKGSFRCFISGLWPHLPARLEIHQFSKPYENGS